MNETIYEAIKRVAKARNITHYSAIAPLADLDMSLDKDRAEIGRILGEISTYEHEQGRPFLSAVVIHKGGSGPGKGFFTLARELGVLQPGEDEDKFWNDELRRVYEEWSG